MIPPILVYPFHKAPKELRALSEHGGDEDFLVIIPNKKYEEKHHLHWCAWLMATDTCGEPSRHELPDGRIVYIGAHA